jgi:hypothetical protein
MDSRVQFNGSTKRSEVNSSSNQDQVSFIDPVYFTLTSLNSFNSSIPIGEAIADKRYPSRTSSELLTGALYLAGSCDLLVF